MADTLSLEWGAGSVERESPMPDRDVKTLRHLIWYQYAKIVARSAFGPEAKNRHYKCTDCLDLTPAVPDGQPTVLDIDAAMSQYGRLS